MPVTNKQHPLLAVRNLAVDFSTAHGTLHALTGLDITLQRGELLALVGESGSGKSVTAQSILQLLPKNAIVRSGSVKLNGVELVGMHDEDLRKVHGGKIGMIFQEPSLTFDPLYPIGKGLGEAIRAHSPELSAEAVTAKSLSLLEEIQLPNPRQRLNNYPYQFSGGQLQRISLAMALSADPEVLIADEPTTALDVTIQAQIIELLAKIRKQRNLAVVFISHDISLVSKIADRIVVLYSGYMLEEGRADVLVHHPRHPYTRALVDSIIPVGSNYRQGRLKSIRGAPPDNRQVPAGCPFAERCDYVKEACRTALPGLVTEQVAVDAPAATGRGSRTSGTKRGKRGSTQTPVTHRCIIPGEKT